MNFKDGLVGLVLGGALVLGGVKAKAADLVENVTHFNIIQLTRGIEFDERTPKNYGDKVVYSKQDNSGSKITIFDLETFNESQISSSSLSTQHYPAIYGDNISFLGHEGGLESDVYLYDISTSELKQLNTGPSGYIPPSIWKNFVTYANGIGNIYLFDLSQNKESKISNFSGQNQKVSISGDNVVYSSRTISTFYNIYVYNIKTGETQQITNNGRHNVNPSIWNNKIVYTRGEEGFYQDDAEVYLYDLTNNEETKITNNSFLDALPVIFGNNIVWTGIRKDEASSLDIIMYDLLKNKETRITHDTLSNDEPFIYGNNIFWSTDTIDSFHRDIYMTKIPEPSTSVLVGAGWLAGAIVGRKRKLNIL